MKRTPKYTPNRLALLPPRGSHTAHTSVDISVRSLIGASLSAVGLSGRVCRAASAQAQASRCRRACTRSHTLQPSSTRERDRLERPPPQSRHVAASLSLCLSLLSLLVPENPSRTSRLPPALTRRPRTRCSCTHAPRAASPAIHTHTPQRTHTHTTRTLHTQRARAGGSHLPCGRTPTEARALPAAAATLQRSQLNAWVGGVTPRPRPERVQRAQPRRGHGAPASRAAHAHTGSRRWPSTRRTLPGCPTRPCPESGQ